SAEPEEPPHNFLFARRSVRWKWTPPRSGDAFIWFDDFSSKSIAVYVGGQLAELESVASDYRAVQFPVEAGTEYQMAVDEGDNHPDPWRFHLTLVPTPSNDTFPARLPLGSLPARV